MIIDLPNTTTSAINRSLVDLRERGGTVSLSRVLTLVIITDEGHAEEAITAANEASFEHPCRVIVVAQGRRRGAPRLDGQIRVGGDAGASEVIVLRLFGELVDHGASATMPLLLPDAPMVAWWPGTCPPVPAEDPIGRLAQRRITDAGSSSRPHAAILSREKSYRPGDTDLAWTRLTLWRGLLASALDQPPFEPILSATVEGASDSPSTDMLAGWLAMRLKCPVTRRKTKAGAGMQAVTLVRKSGPIKLSRDHDNTATLSEPDQPDRQLALPRRGLRDCLAEELRRLDADEVYFEVLKKGLPLVHESDRAKRAGTAAGSAGAPAKTAAAPKTRSTRAAKTTSTPAAKPAGGEDGRPDGEGGCHPLERVVSGPQLVLLPTAAAVAQDIAARLIIKLVDVQSTGRIPSVVLTGGTVGIDLLARISSSSSKDAVDWRRVEFFWGDERFVPANSDDRNEKQAREALLDHIPVDPELVHPMAASDGPYGDDVDRAAAAYATLVDRADPFDVCLLGLGPDGHVASLFPEHPGVYDERPAFAVRNSPKPPPTRISLSLRTIRTSTEVWVVTAGSGKADAVALAMGGAGEFAIPAVGAVGRSRTLWLLDREAAVKLPSSVFRGPIA